MEVLPYKKLKKAFLKTIRHFKLSKSRKKQDKSSKFTGTPLHSNTNNDENSLVEVYPKIILYQDKGENNKFNSHKRSKSTPCKTNYDHQEKTKNSKPQITEIRASCVDYGKESEAVDISISPPEKIIPQSLQLSPTLNIICEDGIKLKKNKKSQSLSLIRSFFSWKSHDDFISGNIDLSDEEADAPIVSMAEPLDTDDPINCPMPEQKTDVLQLNSETLMMLNKQNLLRNDEGDLTIKNDLISKTCLQQNYNFYDDNDFLKSTNITPRKSLDFKHGHKLKNLNTIINKYSKYSKNICDLEVLGHTGGCNNHQHPVSLISKFHMFKYIKSTTQDMKYFYNMTTQKKFRSNSYSIVGSDSFLEDEDLEKTEMVNYLKQK